MSIIQANDYNLVYHSFTEMGCCQMCCFRFIGEKNSSSFLNIEETIKLRNIELKNQDSPPKKIQKSSPCIACLGLLQMPYCDDIMEKVLEEICHIEYDCATFNVALTLPVSLQLRAHSIFLHLKTTFPNFFNFHFPLGVVTVGVKDVWKWLFTSVLTGGLNKNYFTNSDLTITISLKYLEEEKECACLFSMSPDKFSKTKNRKNQGSYDIFSRKSAETYLKEIDSEKFSKNFCVPPSIPDSGIIFSGITTLHNSIFIAGRYNKLSRVLPQTPWILNGERKIEGSVEELISESMKKIIKAPDSRFAASGREDVDVRALGRGRPFYVELIDPHVVNTDFEMMRKLEIEINQKANGQIYIRDLQTVGKKSLDILKEGEEKKSKQYRALCLLLDHSARDKCNSKLAELPGMFPLTIKQSTPIRVLHRRPVAVRDKTINWLKCTQLQDNKDLFTISLNTQAGTYIKEFVHGDFGRTTPSLGELLGGIEVDIIALDVQDILLDWPPSVEYDKQ